MNNTPNDKNGKCITFYSYKGGVGRSMALVNIACLLAKQEKKILLVDWDLEAPGLHLFFKYDKETPGLIDLMLDIKNFIVQENNDEEGYTQFFAENLNQYIDHFISPKTDPSITISMLKAGKLGNGYAEKLNLINWRSIYERSPALFRTFAYYLEKDYDYILIDSRTGLADIGGITTMLMPQKLVLVFVLNEQNINGVVDIAGQAIDYRYSSHDLRRLEIYPLPSRIDNLVSQDLPFWQVKYKNKFEEVLKEKYELDECNLEAYFERCKIPYYPIHAYGENIPVLEEVLTDNSFISYYYNSFLTVLLQDIPVWETINLEQEALKFYEQTTDPRLETTHSLTLKEPRLFPGVTLSSAFTDLKQHRAALIKAIKAHGLTDIAMENDSAKFMDVIDSSLQMVRDGSAYIGVISKKYGQIPPDPIRNPDNLSITELEFNEALRLGRPILLFIMGRDHLVHEEDIEPDPGKKEQLKAFIERAKKMGTGSSVHRIYATFDSLDEFRGKIGPSIASIHTYLDERPKEANNPVLSSSNTLVLDPTPKPLYADPPYIGSNTFVGRDAQLEALNDWARPADPHTILLFEAIGGNGKSMLTWEWTTKHATNVRKDWAGIFWYSFYEKGAVMADFCRRALAYMTGQPLEEFRKKKTAELKEQLLHHLNDRPWLLILDGLERVLVAYHRIDAAEVPDEELNTPTDKIVSRDPCSCINADDDDLLRSLASAAPSKLLVSSRLVPRVFVNAASQPIPGVLRIPLPGLRPTDAEKLFRSYGITGNSAEIQRFLTTNCDCHPLTIGVLAGLVNNYLPDKGNFDAWVTDPSEGDQFNLASLDFIQKRSHILQAALYALSEKNRQLLSTLALLSEAVDYRTLSVLNPHLSSKPDEVPEPKKPELNNYWKAKSDSEKAQLQQQYETSLKQWKAYQQAMETWRHSEEYRNAPKELARTVLDLEQRGLLQYDHNTKRYDLHPVVRGIIVGGLRTEETEQLGQRIVDYFLAQAHNPYEEAETLSDVRNGLNIIRTLLKMGNYQEAYDNYRGSLNNALLFNLEAYTETLALLRPFFLNGWSTLPTVLNEDDGSYLANSAAMALHRTDELKEGLSIWGLLIANAIDVSNVTELGTRLRNVSLNLYDQNNLASEKRIFDLLSALTATEESKESLFMKRLFTFSLLNQFGQWTAAEEMWKLLDPMGRHWPRAVYRPGDAEYYYARSHFWKRDLNEKYLVSAEKLATEGKNRYTIRDIHKLRGTWRMEQGEWLLAVKSLNEAVRMARAIGQTDAESETWLALAKLHLGQLADPLGEAERLVQLRNPAHHPLAELWLAIGNPAQAKIHALAAYRWAWASGEPYVHRYELNKTTELLNRLGVEIPNLPPYDPAKDEKFPWEDKVAAFIEKLKAEKEKKESSSEEDDDI